MHRGGDTSSTDANPYAHADTHADTHGHADTHADTHGHADTYTEDRSHSHSKSASNAYNISTLVDAGVHVIRSRVAEHRPSTRWPFIR